MSSPSLTGGSLKGILDFARILEFPVILRPLQRISSQRILNSLRHCEGAKRLKLGILEF